MRTFFIEIWQEFQLAVADLSNETSLRKVLEIILFWIRRNYKYLAGEPFLAYGFDSFAKVNERVLPVECSSFKVSDLINFKSVILKRQPRDVEAIARFLRDTLEALATVEVDKQCPKCESEGMRVFIGKHNGLLAYQCNVGWC